MNSIVYSAAGDAKSSTLTGLFNRPVLGEDEVMIEVHAFGLNFADILSRKGVYPDAPGTGLSTLPKSSPLPLSTFPAVFTPC